MSEEDWRVTENASESFKLGYRDAFHGKDKGLELVPEDRHEYWQGQEKFYEDFEDEPEEGYGV